jgi:hypothetical protein
MNVSGGYVAWTEPVETTETRFHAESDHGELSPMLGGVVPPSNFRMRLPNGGGDIQLMSMQLAPVTFLCPRGS